jgi:beta-lactam-binding protein with PASTA domain
MPRSALPVVGLEFEPFSADPTTMALRIATRLPRLAVIGLVLLLASATLAVGAAKRLTAVPKGAPAPVSVPAMLVPDVTGQAFVFAKGTLEDNGFAWHVLGSVHGFAANQVATQTPAPGTRVKDTGAPTITVTLERTAYAEKGEPEDVSPYIGTSIVPVGLRSVTPAAPLPVAPKGARKKAAAPKKAAPKVVAPKVTAPTQRPPAFTVPNAPAEPLKEIPLPQRARLLATWIDSHPRPTDANVRHFLYQHTWIVTGAKIGWWHGAEALRELIAADRVAQKRWGIGKRSELVARRALAGVEARAK